MTEARWHTNWGLMVGSVLFSVCAFTVAWFDYGSAQAFARSSHPVIGEVVESNCWVPLCRSGPYVAIAYDKPGTGRVVSELDGVDRRYRVGDRVAVLYSDDPRSTGFVVLPPAEQYYRGGLVRWSLVGLSGLLLAFAAWAFPANLRRLDRRDARRLARAAHESKAAGPARRREP